jgi:hypothetical protein
MTKTTVYFYPKHKEYSEEDHDKAIEEYRAWLDQHGRYGKLYMMHIGKIPKEMIPEGAEPPTQNIMNGVDIYDGEVAMLFRLTFSL